MDEEFTGARCGKTPANTTCFVGVVRLAFCVNRDAGGQEGQSGGAVSALKKWLEDDRKEEAGARWTRRIVAEHCRLCTSPHCLLRSSCT